MSILIIFSNFSHFQPVSWHFCKTTLYSVLIVAIETRRSFAIAIGEFACDFSIGAKIMGCEVSRASMFSMVLLKLSVFCWFISELLRFWEFWDPFRGFILFFGRFISVFLVRAKRQTSVEVRPYSAFENVGQFLRFLGRIFSQKSFFF